MKKVHLSIVTYNNSLLDLDKVYNSIIKTTCDWTLFIIDNSPTDKLRSFFSHKENVIYIFNNANIGFGEAHNLAIRKSIGLEVNYHFIVNPDIYFKDDIITKMLLFMETDINIGMMMPEVLYPNGEIQHLPKLLPSLFTLIKRKLKKPKFFHEKFISRYELRDVPRRTIYNTPILSGCFTLLNIEAIKKIGEYDNKYFMYFEDWDLSRRIHKQFKTIYFPLVSVYHGYDSGASKNLRLFKIYILSAIHYFNKWGWIIDRERNEINRTTLDSIGSIENNIFK